MLAARSNGLFPWPACTFELSGQAIKVGLADAPESSAELPGVRVDQAPAGTVLGADGEGVLVATGRGVLRLLRLQRPGGRMLGAPEFLRGFPLPAGTLLASRPMAPLVGAAPWRR